MRKKYAKNTQKIRKKCTKNAQKIPAKQTMGEKSNDLSKVHEIKAILRRIKKSENAKEKFGNILKLSRYTSYLQEGEKLKVSQCIDVHFISFLLRSDNCFQLFALRLVNSLVAESTQAYLRRCMPFVNSIIFYYCDFVNELNEQVGAKRARAEGKGEGSDGSDGSERSHELEDAWGNYSTEGINDIYCECLEYLLKMLPFLKEGEIVDNSFFPREGNSVSFDADMYFLQKRLKKGGSPPPPAPFGGARGGLKGVKESLHGGEKREDFHVGEAVIEGVREGVSEGVSEGVGEGGDMLEGDTSRDTSREDPSSGEEDVLAEPVSLVELLFDALSENIRMVEVMRSTVGECNGGEELPKGEETPKGVNTPNGENTPKGETPPKGETHNGGLPNGEPPNRAAPPPDKASLVLNRVRGAECLLNSRSVDMTLLLLNNTLLKLSGSQFVQEYFHLLNRVIETYSQNRVTSMKCQINLNVHIKKQGCLNVLERRSVYKLYANIICLFSKVKVQEEKEVLYTLFSSVYSCLSFSFLNERSVDILKTPLSYMNVELYLFAEQVMKHIGGEKHMGGDTYPFGGTSSRQIIPLICRNIEHVVNFIGQDGVCAVKGQAADSAGDPPPRVNLPMGELHTIIGKIKKAIEVVIEFFKDVKSHLRGVGEQGEVNRSGEKRGVNRSGEQRAVNRSGEPDKLNRSGEPFKTLKEDFNPQLTSMMHLLCNYLLFENGHYVDDLLGLLELFAIWADEERDFLAFLLIIKHVHADRYIHSKQFVTKLFLLILDPSMKNIVHIKILYDIFYKCIFNVVESVQIVQNHHMVKFPPEHVHNFFSQDYDLVLPCNIPIDKLNGVPFVYIICEDEYSKRMDDQLFTRNISSLLSFSVNFFFHYYFFFLMPSKGQAAKSESYLFERNYFNASAGHIRTDERGFFLALKVLFTISSLLFLRFDASVLAALLDRHPALFLQDCLIASLLNLKFEVELGKDVEGEGTLKEKEATRKRSKRLKYFLQNLGLTYLVMYYHPTFVSLLIFRLKQVKKACGEIRFQTSKANMQERHLSICAFLNRFIETYV
ncbi:hypothetical protein PVMG_00281 [Plasmodium vivax Mauritania I]|uniref:Uncharacterized protein n=2 Tax=Plasmodium vivax TaxID=5855 RepID=A0A0J9T9T6_PLAVI|nr:hypothetical protein PVMG_00281 [Plasmodium vivax Mauritania I]